MKVKKETYVNGENEQKKILEQKRIKTCSWNGNWLRYSSRIEDFSRKKYYGNLWEFVWISNEAEKVLLKKKIYKIDEI